MKIINKFFKKYEVAENNKLKSENICPVREEIGKLFKEYENNFCFPDDIVKKYQKGDISISNMYSIFLFPAVSAHMIYDDTYALGNHTYYFSDFIIAKDNYRYSLRFNDVLIDEEFDTQIKVYYPETKPYILYLQDYLSELDVKRDKIEEKAIKRAEQDRQEKLKEEEKELLKLFNKKSCSNQHNQKGDKL